MEVHVQFHFSLYYFKVHPYYKEVRRANEAMLSITERSKRTSVSCGGSRPYKARERYTKNAVQTLGGPLTMWILQFTAEEQVMPLIILTVFVQSISRSISPICLFISSTYAFNYSTRLNSSWCQLGQSIWTPITSVPSIATATS